MATSKPIRHLLFVCTSLLLLPLDSLAAPPDAGTILQQVPPTGLDRLPQEPVPPQVQERTDGVKTPPGPTVLVRSFRFTGNTQVSSAELEQAVRSFVGRQLTLGELQAAAQAVTSLYRGKGYPVARAILPRQDVTQGVVTIEIIEGRLGKVQVRDRSGLTANAKAPLESLREGEVLTGPPLERSLLLMSDVPGVEVKSTLTPGATPGTTDLLVDIVPAKRLSAVLSFDNFGGEYSGTYRGMADISVNNPLSLGDQLAIRTLGGFGEGDTRYGRLAYQSPIGGTGLKVGATFSYLYYQLGDIFRPLEASGDSYVASVYANYPIIRTTRANLYAIVSYDFKALDDRMLATPTTHKKINSGTLTLASELHDRFLAGGFTQLSIDYSPGGLHLDDESAATDVTTAKSAGIYNKFLLSLSRSQSIGRNWGVLINFALQRTDRNLDSSEKLQLGGVTGVRSFPTSEAASDDAELGSIEVRRQIGKYVTLGAFYDVGHGVINHHNYTADTNERLLQGAGANLTIYKTGDWAIKGQGAARIGWARASAEPDHRYSLWIQAVKYF